MNAGRMAEHGIMTSQEYMQRPRKVVISTPLAMVDINERKELSDRDLPESFCRSQREKTPDPAAAPSV